MMAGQRRRVGCSLAAGNERRRKYNERERRKKEFIYKGEFIIITSLPFHLKESCVSFIKKGLRLIQEIRVWQLKLDAGINAASKKENARSRLKKRQKGMVDLIWVDFL